MCKNGKQGQTLLKKEPDKMLKNEPEAPVVVDLSLCFCGTVSIIQPAAFLAGVGCCSGAECVLLQQPFWQGLGQSLFGLLVLMHVLMHMLMLVLMQH